MPDSESRIAVLESNQMNHSQRLEREVVVITEKIEGLREQHKAHATETRESIDKLDKKFDDVKTWMEKQKGFASASRLIAGGLGGALVVVVESIGRKIFNG